ncbi:MAG TPA: peptidylprolyl isomerase [Chthoniobacterales bacterium]|nr:peptidylprolyl isomerase [Chthoniobacterales bacterium]
MNRIHLSISTLLLASALTALAQNTPPVVSRQIADFTEYAGAPARSLDLTTAFADSDVSAAVRMTTVFGTMDFELFGQQKPITVANFLNYVDQGKYFILDTTTNQVASSFIHRSEAGFVIQGGGFLGTVNPMQPANARATQVLPFSPIQNEPGISNKRGTIAMAKMGSDPNSATSQWFINLADNSGPPSNLDTQNGGFTVFGRVAGTGMTVADSIAAVPRYNFGSPFDMLPLRNYTPPDAIRVVNLISVPTIARISPLNFSAVSDNTTAVDVVVSGTKLLVSGKQVGTAHATVTATDLDGAMVSQQFTVNVVAAPGRLVQLSTRMQVGTGDNALIGGFIMRGPSPKRLMIRGIGPSSGLNGALADPVLELHDGTGAIIATNDNWGDAANKQDIIDTGIAPNSPNEAAILITVASDPNTANYTAIVRGANNTTGLGLVEVYDLDSGPGSTLLNISTRGQVNVDPNALIGGFFVGGTDSKKILVRAIGPSLPPANVPNPLADPILELRNGSGTLIDQNDDWGSSPNKTAIQNSGVAPTNSKESAVLQTLAAGPYTAIVRGVNNGTGVGSVEVYQLP